MPGLLIVVLAVVAYVAAAAGTYRALYRAEYERVRETDEYGFRSGHEHADRMARMELPAALIWPLSLPFHLARPVPPTRAAEIDEARRKALEAELARLEREAGL